MRLFVYGSLKRGHPHAWRLGGAPLLTVIRTVPGYQLVDLGEYPGMRPGGVGAVMGELYEIDPGRMAALDHFEGHPTLFLRAEVPLADGSRAVAYMATASTAWGAPVITSGRW